MADEAKPDQVVGCATALWSLFVTSPMWLILLFALMSANDMPTWAWVLYWCYVPANILGIILVTVGKVLNESRR